jgi:hypothetical protein
MEIRVGMRTGPGSDRGPVATVGHEHDADLGLEENTMVTITLAREWVDGHGVQHPEGDHVDIPESKLDDMVADGYVSIGGGDEGEDGMRWS